MKKALSILLALLIVFSAVAVGLSDLQFFKAEAAENIQEGKFVYRIIDGYAEITDYTDMESTEEIIIPDSLGGCSVTSIGAQAFCGCNCIAVTIPATVTNIEPDAFAYDMPNLERYTVADANYEYTSDENGVLYKIVIGQYMICGYPKNSPDLFYEVPDIAQAVNDFAFSEVKNLKEIKFHHMFVGVGNYAFYNAKDLEKVSFGANLWMLGDKAFAGCVSLSEVDFGSATVQYLGWDVFEGTPFINDPEKYDEDGVFYYNEHLLAAKDEGDREYYKIKEGTRSVAGGVFDWDSLKEVVIPSSVDYLHYNPFALCGNLEYFTPEGSTLNVDEYGALCKGTSILCYPNGRYQSCYAVEYSHSIYPYAFYLSPIRNFYIYSDVGFVQGIFALGGDEVTDIHFGGDEGGWNALVPDKPSYETRTTAFETANIHYNSYSPDSHKIIQKTELESICSCGYTASLVVGEGEFYENGFSYNVVNGKAEIVLCTKNDTNILVIPETLGGYDVTTVLDKALVNCNCTSLVIPATVYDFGLGAYWALGNLQKITVSPDNGYYSSDSNGILYNADKTELLLCPKNSSLTALTVADSVKEIAPYAFHKNQNIKEVTIPSDVETVRASAFCNSNIETLNIEAGVKRIEDCAFNATQLSSVNLPDSLEYIGWDVFRYTPFINDESNYDSDGVFYYGDYLLASLVNSDKAYYEIKEGTRIIAGAAFEWSSLTEIVVPASAEFVNGTAFCACEKLLKITAASGSTNFSTHGGVLYNYDKTALICYPAGRENLCFSIPQGVTQVNEGAFTYAMNLESLNVPLSVTDIGAFAFGTVGIEKIKSVRYEGTREQWDKIRIADDPDPYSGSVCIAKVGSKVFGKYTEGDHQIVSHTLTSPTCTAIGQEIFACECGYKYVISTPAHGHIPEEEYVVAIKADCTTKEKLELYCSVCDKLLETKYNPALGHNNVFVEYLEPTCDLVGGSLYKCSRCSREDFTQEEPELGHTAGDEIITIEATCTTDGGVYYACERCGVRMGDAIETYPAPGHVETDWICIAEPTCVQERLDVKYCEVCGEEISWKMGILGDHNYVERVIEETCGLKIIQFTCSYCSNTYNEEIQGELGHITESVVVDATCSEAGAMYDVCTVCGETVGEVTVIEPLGHKNTEKITKESTCSEEGVKTVTCTVCGEVSEEAVAKIPHTFGSWEYDSGSTFSGVCSVCGSSFDSIEVKITLGSEEITLYNKTSKSIAVSVTENISDELVYKSSDESVAVVDANGKVTAKAPGTAVVTVRIKGTEIMAQCKVTVAARSFGVEWICDGELIEYSFVEEGGAITSPAAPEKLGYEFVGWTPEIPDAMPAHALSFTAVYNIVSKSASYDVSATYSADTFAEPVSLDVAEVAGDREPGGVYMVDGEYYKQVGLYNIKAVNSESEVVQPNDGYKVTIKLPIPEAYKNRTEFVINHRFVDGTREQLSTANGTLTVKDGYLIFEVSSFSEFEILIPSANIRITRLPDKTRYNYKDGEIDLTGIRIKLTKADGTTKTITNPDLLTVNGFDGTKVGTQTVTVSYGEYSDKFDVTVEYAWWQQLIRIMFLGFLWY